MSRTVIAQHYARILSRWPSDALRPEVQFQKILRDRSQSSQTAPPHPSSTSASSSKVPTDTTLASERDAQLDSILGTGRGRVAGESEQVNALYSLLEGRYASHYALPQSALRPRSDPEYYERLRKQLEETPQRGWFGNLARRLSGMVRFN